MKRLLVEIYEAKGHHSSIGNSAATCGSSGAGESAVTGLTDLPAVVRRPRGKQSPPMVIVGNKCDREAQRAVTVGELHDLAESTPQCVGLEVSAKKNYNVEEIFIQLFVMARLPTEMSPSQHRRVPITYVGAGGGSSSGAKMKKGVSLDGEPVTGRREGSGRGGALMLRRQLSDACGAVAPNVRRPSIRTDLLLLQTRCRAAAAASGALGSFRGQSGSDREINLIRKDSGRCLIQ